MNYAAPNKEIAKKATDYLTIPTTWLVLRRPPPSEKCIVRMRKRTIASEPAGICCAVLWTWSLWCAMSHIIMSMYQWVSLEMRTAATASLGCLLLYLVSLIVTIVLLLVLCVCNAALCALVGPLLRSHRFVVIGIVRHKHLCIQILLYNPAPIVCRIL